MKRPTTAVSARSVLAVALLVTACGGSDASTAAPSDRTTISASPRETGAAPAPTPAPPVATTSDDEASFPVTLYAALRDGRVVEADARTGAVLRTLATYEVPDSEDPVATFLDSLEVDDEGRLRVGLCCEPAAGAVDVLDTATGERLFTHFGYEPDVSDDQRRYAAPSSDGMLVFGPAGGGDATSVASEDDFLSMALPDFSPDGETLVVAVNSHPDAPGRTALLLLDAVTPDLDAATVLASPDGRAWTLPQFRADGKLLAMEDNEEDARTGVLVDPASGERLAAFPVTPAVSDWGYNRARSHLLIVHEDGSVTWQGRGQGGDIALPPTIAAAW